MVRKIALFCFWLTPTTFVVKGAVFLILCLLILGKGIVPPTLPALYSLTLLFFGLGISVFLARRLHSKVDKVIALLATIVSIAAVITLTVKDLRQTPVVITHINQDVGAATETLVSVYCELEKYVLWPTGGWRESVSL